MQTQKQIGKAEDENYRTTEKCDGCGTLAAGTMHHAAGATGRVCPVIFLCDACRAPERPNEQPLYLGIGWSEHAKKWYCRMQEWGGNPHDTFFTSREEAQAELARETVRLAPVDAKAAA